MKPSSAHHITSLIYLFILYTYAIIQYLILSVCYIKHIARVFFYQVKARVLWEQQSESALQYIKKQSLVLTKLPKHVGVIVDSKDALMPHIAELVSWCIGADIHYITLYDVQGEIKRQQAALKQTLSISNKELLGKSANLYDVRWCIGKGAHTDDSISPPYKAQENGKANQQEYFLYLTSYEDGKPQIVNAVKRICKAVEDKRMRAKDVSYELLQANIRAYPSSTLPPDPELILNFDESGMTLGFMPWHIRLSEIMSMGPLRDSNVVQFMESLRAYSKCDQRLGK